MKLLKFLRIHLVCLMILFSVSAFAADADNFNINVSVAFLELSVEDILGNPYPGWMPDTLAMDTTIFMQDGDVAVLRNEGNVPLSLYISANDMPDDWLLGYRQWILVNDPEFIDEYALAIFDTSAATIDPSSSSWQDVDTLSNLFIPVLDEDFERFLFFYLRTPFLTSDHYGHQIIVTIEATVP